MPLTSDVHDPHSAPDPRALIPVCRRAFQVWALWSANCQCVPSASLGYAVRPTTPSSRISTAVSSSHQRVPLRLFPSGPSKTQTRRPSQRRLPSVTMSDPPAAHAYTVGRYLIVKKRDAARPNCQLLLPREPLASATRVPDRLCYWSCPPTTPQTRSVVNGPALPVLSQRSRAALTAPSITLWSSGSTTGTRRGRASAH